MLKHFSVFLSLLLAWPCQVQALTYSESITRARVMSKDVASTRQRFTDAQIQVWLQESSNHVSMFTHCLDATTTFMLVPNTTYYAVPNDFMGVKRITLDALSLPEMSMSGLDGRSQGWELASGRPTYYFVNFSRMNSTNTALGFAPWPFQSNDTGTIKMEYVATGDMTSSTTSYTGTWPQSYMYLTEFGQIYYAASKMADIDGRFDDSKQFYGEFAWAMGQLDKFCRFRPNYTPSASGRP